MLNRLTDFYLLHPYWHAMTFVLLIVLLWALVILRMHAPRPKDWRVAYSKEGQSPIVQYSAWTDFDTAHSYVQIFDDALGCQHRRDKESGHLTWHRSEPRPDRIFQRVRSFVCRHPIGSYVVLLLLVCGCSAEFQDEDNWRRIPAPPKPPAHLVPPRFVGVLAHDYVYAMDDTTRRITCYSSGGGYGGGFMSCATWGTTGSAVDTVRLDSRRR